MESSSKLRQQLVVGLTGSAILSAIIAVGAVAARAHEESEIGPMQKVYCTLSPRATIDVDELHYEVNPPDVVIPC